jgi:hypothetical protein
MLLAGVSPLSAARPPAPSCSGALVARRASCNAPFSLRAAASTGIAVAAGHWPPSACSSSAARWQYSQFSMRRRPGSPVVRSKPSSTTTTATPAQRLQRVIAKIDELNSKDIRTVEVGLACSLCSAGVCSRTTVLIDSRLAPTVTGPCTCNAALVTACGFAGHGWSHLAPSWLQVDGQQVPYELAYSRWLTSWVEDLTADSNPPASEELLIVARGQHVERWKLPRESYPEVRWTTHSWVWVWVAGGGLKRAGVPLLTKELHQTSDPLPPPHTHTRARTCVQTSVSSAHM